MLLVLAGLACSPAPAPVSAPSSFPGRVLGPGCAGSPYATIQAAIDAALPGDVVEVCPGTYREHLLVVGKALTLRSSGGAATTEVDAEHTGRALEVREGADVSVVDLTFRNGDAGVANGGDVYCSTSALDLTDSVVLDGIAVRGGGLATRSCSGTVSGTRFEGNHADRGGASYVDEGGGGGDVDFVGNVVVSNTSSGQGAGLYFLGGSPLIDRNDLVGNVSDSDGGGLRIKLAQATISDNVFLRNRAGHSGGGLKVSHEVVTLSGNVFVANRAGSGGGGTYLFESASLLSNETYAGNRARRGGALDVVGGWGAVTVEDSTFRDDVARAEGGHLHVDLPGFPVVLRRVVLSGGTAERGGAVFAEDSTLTVQNSLLEANVATLSGGAVYVVRSDGELVNDVFFANEAPDGSGVFVDEGAAGLGIVNTVFAEHVGGPTVTVGAGIAPDLRYDDLVANPADAAWLAWFLGMAGNLAVAPGFVDAPGGDYSLEPTSALVDAGDPAITDLGGSRSDVGLYGGPDAD
jgi:hypothetical protein